MDEHRFWFRGRPVDVMTRRGVPREEAEVTAKQWAKDEGLDDEKKDERQSQGRAG
jgi:hypothetical protein